MNQPRKSMISYSSSFEDVILQRALQHVERGCYVDVGAFIPLGDSNTAAFYRKGWRGICLEPITHFNDRWAKDRPEDILINAAAGAAAGETTFYLYKATSQISTCSAETVAHWKSHNYVPDETYTVPVVTLNDIMEQHLHDRTLHLLSIDAEGYEKEILQGFNLKKYCPWIIIIEATVPGTNIASYQRWESDVLAAGYTMVYDDSINRFYLSDTKPELKPYFMAPPNIHDEFISVAQENMMQECEILKQEVSTLQRQLVEVLSHQQSNKLTYRIGRAWNKFIEQLIKHV